MATWKFYLSSLLKCNRYNYNLIGQLLMQFGINWSASNQPEVNIYSSGISIFQSTGS